MHTWQGVVPSACLLPSSKAWPTAAPSTKKLGSSLCPQALTQAVGALLAAIEPGLGVVLAAAHKHAHAAGRLAAGESVQGMATTVLVPGVKGNGGVDALKVGCSQSAMLGSRFRPA